LVLEPAEVLGDAAFMDSLRFLHYRSLEEAGLSFELGRLDIITLLGEAPPKFVTRGSFSSQNSSTISYVILGINGNREFQRSEIFGKALSFLVDRDAIIRVILGGSAARPVYGGPGTGGPSVALSLPFLPDSADYYINSLESKPEFLTLYIDSAYPVLTKVARYIEGQLLNKGIRVAEKTVDLALSDDFRIGSDLDMYLTYFTSVSTNPDCFFYPLYKRILAGQTNFLYFNDEAMQTFLNDLHTEPDFSRRDSLASGLAQSLTANPSAVILYEPFLTVISKMDISGTVVDPAGYLDLRRAFIEYR
jgi:ABC-type transport system substrate-binding protein